MPNPNILPEMPDQPPTNWFTLNVDGGMTDNDPMELASDFLAATNPNPCMVNGCPKNPKASNAANCAVLSIAPFPVVERYNSKYFPQSAGDTPGQHLHHDRKAVQDRNQEPTLEEPGNKYRSCLRGSGLSSTDRNRGISLWIASSELSRAGHGVPGAQHLHLAYSGVIASFLSKRSVELEDSIRQMLVDPDLTRAFFTHPLITSLTKARPQTSKSGSAAKMCLPTYIPPDIFRKVQQSLLTQKFALNASEEVREGQ